MISIFEENGVQRSSANLQNHSLPLATSVANNAWSAQYSRSQIRNVNIIGERFVYEPGASGKVLQFLFHLAFSSID